MDTQSTLLENATIYDRYTVQVYHFKSSSSKCERVHGAERCPIKWALNTMWLTTKFLSLKVHWANICTHDCQQKWFWFWFKFVSTLKYLSLPSWLWMVLFRLQYQQTNFECKYLSNNPSNNKSLVFKSHFDTHLTKALLCAVCSL